MSCQYPDDGGGLPYDKAYWPTAGFESWIKAFLDQFDYDDRNRAARTAQRRHGWMDRAVRLVQQQVPDRDTLPDLVARPESREGVRHLALRFPVEGCSMMPFWTMLRWLMRIDPFAGELRIHCLLAQSVSVPEIRDVAAVLLRELPKGTAVRRAWAEVVDQVADGDDDPEGKTLVAALFARAYLAAPDLAEAILARGCRPETVAEEGVRDGEESLQLLCVYGGVLRDIAATMPRTMALLRAPNGTAH